MREREKKEMDIQKADCGRNSIGREHISCVISQSKEENFATFQQQIRSEIDKSAAEVAHVLHRIGFLIFLY